MSLVVFESCEVPIDEIYTYRSHASFMPGAPSSEWIPLCRCECGVQDPDAQLHPL